LYHSEQSRNVWDVGIGSARIVCLKHLEYFQVSSFICLCGLLE
jgi:hypothetical protein